ncbi:MAG: transcriptional repressor [Pseudomonadota bacterium]
MRKQEKNKQGEKMQEAVLATLCQHDCTMSACDIMLELSKTYPKIAPQAVNRALSALSARGCVHRIESFNSYFACQSDTRLGHTTLSICNDCGTIAQNIALDLPKEFCNVIGQSGFLPLCHVTEVHGLCGPCNARQVSA